MAQQPITDNSFAPGIIVNEANYTALDEVDCEAQTDTEQDTETGIERFIILPPLQH